MLPSCIQLAHAWRLLCDVEASSSSLMTTFCLSILGRPQQLCQPLKATMCARSCQMSMIPGNPLNASWAHRRCNNLASQAAGLPSELNRQLVLMHVISSAGCMSHWHVNACCNHRPSRTNYFESIAWVPDPFTGNSIGCRIKLHYLSCRAVICGAYDYLVADQPSLACVDSCQSVICTAFHWMDDGFPCSIQCLNT
jgi:hypothetical protein